MPWKDIEYTDFQVNLSEMALLGGLFIGCVYIVSICMVTVYTVYVFGTLTSISKVIINHPPLPYRTMLVY